jgi:exodeoxyribonuclease III
VKPLSVTNGIGAKKHDDEGRTITAEFVDYFLVVTYVPSSGQKLDRLTYRTTEWDTALLAYLQGLEKKKPVVWTGDLNVAHHDHDIHSPKTNQKSAGFTPAERANFGATVSMHVPKVTIRRNST